MRCGASHYWNSRCEGMTGGSRHFRYCARNAARSLRMTSIAIAITSNAAIVASCQTGPQSVSASAPAVHERTYSMMNPLSPIY